MLTYIAVKNLTVIESASLEFSNGLNVITGETGAGKSVLVGALKFLMGDRLNRAVLRDPSQKLFVEGIFADTSKLPSELIEQYEIEDELILSRECDDSGKNKVYINGRVAPVNKLREFSEYLIDIHGQHEHQVLFDPAKHLTFLDYFIDKSVLSTYATAYSNYATKYSELAKMKEQISETSKLKEMYEFQLEEINSLDINLEFDSVIDDKIDFLSNIEKIKEATAQCIDMLEEGEISALSLVGRAERAISGVAKTATELEKASESLAAAESYIKDAVSYISSVFDNQLSNPNELNDLIDRKYKLVNIMKKYGTTLEDVLKYRDEIDENLNNVSFSNEKLAKLEQDVKSLEDIAIKQADNLNAIRMEKSLEISNKVVTILKDLELPQSRFEVRFKNAGKLDSHGGVSAEFFISTNAGFDLGPLSTVASGGEVSRVMLALKEVFADADCIDTLLFDEIDTGISGKAAKSVAEKLDTLSNSKQIIVITHLPVVAAKGDCHFHITKGEQEGVSKTTICKIDEIDRKNVIATMISGEVTPASLDQANELMMER